MQLELILFILFLVAELFEIVWQKSPTLEQMLYKGYGYYRKSPFLLYLMHPSYILSIYLFDATHYSPWVLAIVAIKSVDIIIKILLIQKHFIQQRLSKEMLHMLLQPLPPMMLFIGISFYPYLLFMALF